MDSSGKQNSSGIEAPPASRKLNSTFWIAFSALLSLQIGIAIALCFVTGGKEYANDTTDYRQYLKNPNVLLTSHRTTGLGGGFAAAPFLPYLIYLPYKLFCWLGVPEEYQLFLGLRFVVISWAALGLILSWRVLQQTWKIQPILKDRLFALLILCMPLTIIAPAVMTQDDSVCLGWAGIGFYCWHRWGVGCLLIVVALGVWMAKPFLLFMFPAIWMSYPQWRTKIVLICGAVTISLLGFFYWRDGSLRIFSYTENGSNSATLYSVGWLLQPNFDFANWRAHGAFVKALSTPIFLITMSAWCLSSWLKPYALPVAVVGTYFVFFMSQTMLMPEYEFWFLPWTMWLMWWCVRNQHWYLLGLCWLHSSTEYLYKLLYACDSVHFLKKIKSPLEDIYSEHFGYDLRWALSAVAIAAALCRLAIVVNLWKMRDTITVNSTTPQKPL